MFHYFPPAAYTQYCCAQRRVGISLQNMSHTTFPVTLSLFSSGINESWLEVYLHVSTLESVEDV